MGGEEIRLWGRVLDLFVGPRPPGRTPTLGGVRAVREAEHGRGSVVGLAPLRRQPRFRPMSWDGYTEHTTKSRSDFRL